MHNILVDRALLKMAPDAGSASTFILSAGTSDVNSSVIDLASYQGNQVDFIIQAGAIAGSGSLSIKAQHSDNGTDFTDISGTTIAWADTDDYKIGGIPISRVSKRYLRLAITRGDGGNSAVDALLAVIGGNRVVPVSQSTGTGQFVAAPSVVAP